MYVCVAIYIYGIRFTNKRSHSSDVFCNNDSFFISHVSITPPKLSSMSMFLELLNGTRYCSHSKHRSRLHVLIGGCQLHEIQSSIQGPAFLNCCFFFFFVCYFFFFFIGWWLVSQLVSAFTMNVKLNSKKIVGYRVNKRVVHGRRERKRIERESCYLILGVDRSTNFSKQGMHKICQMPVDFFFQLNHYFKQKKQIDCTCSST
jgi:hypothetical protein